MDDTRTLLEKFNDLTKGHEVLPGHIAALIKDARSHIEAANILIKEAIDEAITFNNNILKN